MSTSSVNGVQTSVAASGQSGAASTKGSALFGTPQASGDFLAMLMGAFGSIAPVTGVTNMTQTSDNISETSSGLLLTPVADDGSQSRIPMADLGGEGLSGTADLADETFTEFLKSALNAADHQDVLSDDLSKQSMSQGVSGLPGTEELSENGAGGQAAMNFGDRLGVQHNTHGVDASSELIGDDQATSTIPTVQAGDDPTKTLAEQLNAMIVGGNAPQKGNKDGEGRGYTSPLGALNGLLTPANDTGYTPTFLMAQDGYQPPAQASSSASPTTLGAGSSPEFLGSDDLSDLSNLDQPVDLSFDGTTTSDRSGPSQTTATSTQSIDRSGTHAATTAHNMTQAVAVHLQSMAQNRDTRSLTLHLDPPELGKMQIKMSYGRDKSVRADVLVEKPDTLRLMEQDSTTLKSALDNAGLQTDAGSLNFSLADQGAFQNSESQAFLGNTNNNSDQALGVDDIAGFEFKSTEEWSVDPSTGITRYNIVV